MLLATPGVEELVAAYFDSKRTFAADTFRALEPWEPNTVSAADLLAVTLLVPVPALAVRQVLADASEVACLLADVPHDVPLCDASTENLVAACTAFDQLVSYYGVGEVIAGKLLARKRPALVPIVDDKVRRVLCLPDDRAWTALRTVLRDGMLRERIDRLQPLDVPDQPTIRLLDVAAWMRGTEARDAQKLRKRLGITGDGWRCQGSP